MFAMGGTVAFSIEHFGVSLRKMAFRFFLLHAPHAVLAHSE